MITDDTSIREDTTMESFHWDNNFVTGLAQVDSEHHHLVDVINQFGELLTHSEGVPFDEIERVFGELAAYAQYHFTMEESLMVDSGIDPRHLERHRQEHTKFLQEVTRMHAGVSREDPDKAKPLLKFLIAWLAYHILGSDQSMARQIGAIQSGQTAADAYLAETQVKEGAVEPLLHALAGLFEQVSERNRELLELNQSLEAKVVKRTRELSIANQRLEEIASTDVLTGLLNRRGAFDLAARDLERARRFAEPICGLMFDLDHFKSFNDTYGHAVGDEVLQEVAVRCKGELRQIDIIGRYGGEEFAVFLPGTDIEGAAVIGERLRSAINAEPFATSKGPLTVSISLGVALATAATKTPEELLGVADTALYKAKESGRNCVCIAEQGAVLSRAESFASRIADRLVRGGIVAKHIGDCR